MGVTNQMANIKSAKKRVRQNVKLTAHNQPQISAMRTAIKNFNMAVEEGAENIEALYTQATKVVDQAKSKNLIHANKAAREKSKLARKLNATKA